MSKFVMVKCNCGYEQAVFKHAKSKIKCMSCGATLVDPKGGKANIRAKVEKEL